ncbi:hypothetical protein MMC13_002757 [Lambiella insularis]|nr:hypothetical protein [Lambiella insularis]
MTANHQTQTNGNCQDERPLPSPNPLTREAQQPIGIQRPWRDPRSPPVSPMTNGFPQNTQPAGHDPLRRFLGQPARDLPWHGAITVASGSRQRDSTVNGGRNGNADLASTHAQVSGSERRATDGGRPN